MLLCSIYYLCFLEVIKLNCRLMSNLIIPLMCESAIQVNGSKAMAIITVPCEERRVKHCGNQTLGTLIYR